MEQKEIVWLRCKVCKSRCRYEINPEHIDHHKNKLYLAWDISCKNCDRSLQEDNIAETTKTELLCKLLVEQLMKDREIKEMFEELKRKAEKICQK